MIVSYQITSVLAKNIILLNHPLMIKKIKTEQLKIGMYVHDFNCDKADEHVFISKALIKTEKAIQILDSWGIKEVYIDTLQGLDVERRKTNNKVTRDRRNGSHKMQGSGHSPPPDTTPLKEEVKIANTIKKEAVDIMQQAMVAAEEGKDIDVGNAFQLVEKMEKSVSRNKDALLLLTRMRRKDEYTLMHSISVSSLVLAFCNFSGIDYNMTINLAIGALLHDIGKTKIPIAILNKPGKLNPEEYTIIQKHAEYSADILADKSELPSEVFDIALHHHERRDGSGYPDGLKGDAIGFGPKVVSLCDVYDAITSDRCYQNGIDKVGGLKILYDGSNLHFDKKLAYDFIRFIGVYPIGTCIKLENELVGVVTGSSGNLLQPVVRLFYSDKKKAAIRIQEINLSEVNIDIASYEASANWSSDKKQQFNTLRKTLGPLQ